MVDLSKIALARQMLESAEKSVQSAKQLLAEVAGVRNTDFAIQEKARTMATTSEGGRVIEGIFDGQNMVGPNGKQYPVPANYASKSKLVQGDKLKLTILDDGSFIYKQIGPVDRKKIIGTLAQTEKGVWSVMATGRVYKVLLASVTYFKGEAGDEVTLVVPEAEESEWGAIENVISKTGNDSTEEPSMADLDSTDGGNSVVDLDQEVSQKE